MSNEGSGATRAAGGGIHNEDAFLVEEGLGLYVVCDGASGSPAGEVAARVATEAIEGFIEHAEEELDLRGSRVARKVVESALHHALSAVTEVGRTDPELGGLATTVTLLLAHGDHGVIGHRGDSRAYLIRRDRAHQLTVDHEFAEDVSHADESRNPASVFAIELEPNDTIILCTDGAEEVVQDEAIIRVAGDLSPRLLASRIVSAAHRRRPEADATAVVVRVRGGREPGWLELSIPARGTAFGHTLQYA